MKRTARKSGPDRRAELVRATLGIIAERGYGAVTTASLAAEVGLTTGALYRHFASLDELLIATVRHGVERIDTTFPDPALPPLERLLALARARVRLLRESPGLVWLLRSEQALLALPSPAVAELREVVGRSRAFVLGALRDGIADSTIRDDIDPEVLFVPVVATIHAVVGPRAARRTSSPPSADPDRVLDALALLLQPSEETKR